MAETRSLADIAARQTTIADTDLMYIESNLGVPAGITGKDAKREFKTDISKTGRNALINGGFDIWQRGTSFTGSEYTADRWLATRAGSKTHTITRQDFTLGQTAVPGNPAHYLRAVVGGTDATNGYSAVSQRIEGVASYSGEEITLSFYGKADSSKDIAIKLVQNFGTGGSPSTDVTTTVAANVTLGTTMARHSFTLTLPSVSGKTLGTNGDDYLAVDIVLSAGSAYAGTTNSLGDQTGTFEIANVQLERGDAATDFEQRNPAVEMMLCQRYYQVLRQRSRWWSSSSSDADARSYPFQTRMREAPSIASSDIGGRTNIASIAIQADSPNEYRVEIVPSSASGSVPTYWYGVLSCDAEL